MEDIMLEFYRNVDPRRKQELADSRMIYEDKAAMANLKNEPTYHEFNPDKFVEKLNMFNQSNRKRR